MTKIDCNLFGSISIKEDGEDIFLPVGKVSGLFFYILFKRSVSRDELAGIFWSFSSEQKARTSLRNAIHKLKKAFKSEIILSPNKSILVLNEDLDFNIDFVKFQENPINNLDLYAGDFLKGFYINDTIDFEYWLLEKRNYYEELFIKSIESKIIEDYENKNFENIKINIYNLIDIDNYNELAYEYLLKYYISNGRFDKAINEYHNLKNLLDKELGISPSKNIKNIYNDALKSIELTQGKGKKQVKKNLYRRDYELQLMQKNVDDFKNGLENKTIFIMGESGIGKTELKNKLLNSNSKFFKIYEVDCLRVEKDFAYSTWIKIIKEIDKDLENKHYDIPSIWSEMKNNIFFKGEKADFYYGNITENRENFNKNLILNSLITAFEELSSDNKILIVIKDIQWSDNLSVNILINLIIQLNKNIMFIISSTEDIDKNSLKLLESLITLNKLEIIHLQRFNKEEVASIVREELGNKKIKDEIINNIYEKSLGNTFLLHEYIKLYKEGENEKIINSKIYSLFDEKFASLDEFELKLLQTISSFYSETDITSLLKVTKFKAFDVIDAINNLIKKDIIKEELGDDFVSIEFTNKPYKEYIYNTLSETAKCVINEEIAKTLEEEFKNGSNDVTLYIKLKFHYERSNKIAKALHYEICILNYYLNFNHEIFPKLDDYDINHQVKMNINNDKALNWLNEIEKKIINAKNNTKQYSDIRQSEILFGSIKGRYLIRCGSYSDGIRVLNSVINMAKAERDYETLINGYKQKAIYGIQINNPDIMEINIKEGIKVASKINSSFDLGVLYRMYGVNNLMRGKFKSALELFEKSISLLNNNGILGLQNSISVAANYNYIGEIKNAEGNFREAMKYYNLAISLCKHTEAPCLSLFYINAGKTSFLMNNIKDMKMYLELSEEKINEFDSYWKKTVLNAFIALLKFIEKDYDSCISYLGNAVSEEKTLNNPRDIGIVYLIKAIIRTMINDDELKGLSLKNTLVESKEFYFYKAINYLDPYRDSAEIAYLKKIVDLR